MRKTILTVIMLTQFSLFAPGIMLHAQGTPDEVDPQRVYERNELQPGQLGFPARRPVNTGQIVTNDREQDTSGKNRHASDCSTIKFKSLIDILIWLKCIAVTVLVPLIFSAAFVVFLWGVLKYMYSADKTKREESKKLVWWGLIGLFVMVSVWGILQIVSTTLGIDTSAVPRLDTTYLDVDKASK